MSDLNLTAYCGLDCAECRAFRATQAKDSTWKRTIANQWSEELKEDFKPEDINCNGCKSATISGWCRKICKIRPCAEQKKVKTCAECQEYQCVKLKQFLLNEPIAAKNLEEIRRILQK
jgi:hypothetical protein